MSQKKALHLFNSYLGLTETFMWNSLSSLREYTPVILAARYENLSHYPLPKAAFIEQLPLKGRLPSLLARLHNRFAAFNYSPCLPELGKQTFQVAHCHYGYRAIVSQFFLNGLKVPYLTTFYGRDLSDRRFLRRAQSQYRRLFEEGHGFCVEGPAMQKRLEALGCPRDKIHLMPISIKMDRYFYRERHSSSKSSVRFLFVGRLCEKKGILTAVKALGAIKHTFPWQFTVIGAGELENKLRDLVTQLGLSDRVKFTGTVDFNRLPEILDSHDILLQPSETASNGDSEGGAPTVLLEAQASGMPVVSTTHDDIPFVVRPDQSAYLSPEKDAKALSENLLKIDRERDRWPQMGRAGRAHVEEQHEGTAVVQKLENLYDSLS